MIRKVIRNKEYIKIFENIFSLSLINGINYIFPIIIIPYLTRIVGLENYGKYSFAYSIIIYLTIFVSYGFDFSATKKIAQNREKKEYISRVFCSVVLTRIIISIICYFVLTALIYFIPALRMNKLLYLPAIGFFIGSSLMPTWLFQGLEDMKYITILNFISRSSSLLLIFLFIKVQSDYLYINLMFSSGYLLAGIAGFFLAFLKHKIIISIPKIKDLVTEIKNGWQIFLSMIFMNMYRNAGIIILGLVSDYKYVGIYSAAEKITKAFQAITSPISNALYPYFGRTLNKKNIVNGLKNYFRFIKIYAFLLALIVIGIMSLSNLLIDSYLPQSFLNSKINIKIMSVIILFGGLNYFLGMNGLVNLGYEKMFSKAVIIVGIVNIPLCFSLSYLFKDIGASISMSIIEFIFTIILFIHFRKIRNSLVN